MYESVRLPLSRLQDAGHSVTVYGVWDDKFPDAVENWAGIDVNIFQSPMSTFGVSKNLFEVVTSRSHDLLHLHGIWTFCSFVSHAWHKLNQRPTILSPRGMLDEWAFENSFVKKRIAWSLYERKHVLGATLIHALNMEEAKSCRKLGLPNPIAIIPNGVDIPQCSGFPRPAIFGDSKILLSLSRIHPKKGLLNLLKAWSILQSKTAIRKDWKLAIVGWDDGGLTELQKYVDEKCLNSVIFTGPLYGEQKSAVFEHSNGFILPSLSEGLPMSVLEAWSWKLPVFMTKYCNLSDAFLSDAAYEIDSDPQLMARKIDLILDDLAMRNAGENGFKLVQERYTWSSVSEQLSDVYLWMKNGDSMPGNVLID
jgi:poly(glycerol-phosphate) alpha-glucosyltransferase